MMDKGEKNRNERRVIKEGERKGKKNEIRVIKKREQNGNEE